MELSRQEYWSELPFPSGDLPDPGIEPGSPALQADALPSEVPGKPLPVYVCESWTIKKTEHQRIDVQFSSVRTSLVAQRLKHLPAMWETWVRSLGREDPLEKEMANHSSILAWRIPWTEEPGGLQSMVSQRVGHD